MASTMRLLAALAFAAALAAANPPLPGVFRLDFLPTSPGNPRNTEGSFVTLRDGRLLYIYTRFTGGGHDHDTASVVARTSADNGRTWSTADTPVVAGEGAMNVMSVSLLRLRDGRIALFYVRKNSFDDCRPYLRTSTDEGATWSEPTLVISDEKAYFVLNNDRVVQLRSGRLIVPVARHKTTDGEFNPRGEVFTYLSDDAGRTWRRGRSHLESPVPSRNGLQEPGVVELKGGRVLMFIRTQLGSQYLSYSSDGGETWSAPAASSIQSPLSPASIKRIPSTGHLLLVWNDHAGIDPSFRASNEPGAGKGGKRTPLTVAISKDEGRTWIHARDLETAPDGWYCYTAIHFVKDHVLLAYVSGGRGRAHLDGTALVRFPVAALYKP